MGGIIGQVVKLFSSAFLPPLLLAMWDRQWFGMLQFILAGLFTFGCGVWLSRGFSQPRHLHRTEALAIVALTWLTLSVFAAVPYLLVGMSIPDALFESMSGLTTTGATIITDFNDPKFTRSFFLWRSMTQWFGGLGIIALFVVVLPRLGIAGRQLFFAEASGAPGEAVNPQIRKAAGRLWIVYVVLTVVCAALLYSTGMSPFDALCHSLTTLSAGGFSPNGESVAGYGNAGAEWVLVLFMFLGGASYPLQYKVYTGDPFGFFRDGEFLFYLAFTVGIGLLAAVAIFGLPEASTTADSLRQGLFQSASLASSTGFASTDYNRWPDAARGLLLVIMVVGGCAGSAAGGPKCIRHLLVSKHIIREIKQVLHPRAVLVIVYKARAVPPAIMRAVFTLAVLYAGGYFLIGVLLVVTETDVITGFSASIACLGNIGPGFSEVGPMGSYANFAWFNKLLLYVAMWVGRLEIVTVLALLHPHVWRNLRWAE